MLTPIDLPQTDSGPFLSYALQWAAFGVIALIGIGVFVFREASRSAAAGRSGRADAGNGPPTDDAGRPQPATRRRARDGFDRSQLYDD